jgi:hypothetical protein
MAQIVGLAAVLDAKQPLLESGTNIKTLNGESLLGSGDMLIEAGGGGPVNIDGGSAASVYGELDVIDGGNASG